MMTTPIHSFNRSLAGNRSSGRRWVIVWLHLFSALLAFLLTSLFLATHSELGDQISTGESPLFSWVRSSMPLLLVVGLVYRLVVHWVQFRELRLQQRSFTLEMKVFTWSEAVVVGILAFGFLRGWEAGLTWGLVLFQISILLQILVTLWRSGSLDRYPTIHSLGRSKKSTFLFLFFLFLLAAVPAYFDPLWKKMQVYVQLDSGFEIFLSRILPPVLSGVTGLWFGIGTLAILAGLRVFWSRVQGKKGLERIFSLSPFFFITGLSAAVWLKSLIHAIYWELHKLHLMPTMISLFILLCVGGGFLFFTLFQRISTLGPQGQERSQIGILSLSLGALFLLPIMWPLTRKGGGRWSWRLLLFFSLSGSLFLGYYVLYGNLFDPWFTAFSYLKGAILMATALVAAGTLVLFFEELFPSGAVSSPRAIIVGLLLLIIFFAGFLPFRIPERHPEVKVANLQLNELSMVDATFARELADTLGLTRWVRLGQNPSTNRNPEPWPLPWTLKKTHPSLLPKDFNLIVIVVDALRGDAFRSAGYERNLTPFLDRWALEEAISFRRAYSQGGGSFAAIPFLVAGRSQFKLYGPNLFRKNLYFKLAQAEGIKNMMVIKEFGPRAIFPPDYPVIELDRSKVRNDRRSVPADEVFQWAKDDIDNLPKDERFLCFLQLMDVHNDLWKKEDGLNLGDSPRDLYDNNLSYVDRAVKRFVLWLKERGIYDRTVILFTSDHGEQFWEHGASLHGHTLYEEEIRVPLILLAHGIRKRVEDVPVLSSDIAPTLADLAGYSVDPPYDDPHMGISLVPLLTGKEHDRYLKRDIVGRASFKRRYFLYRNWEWKLIYLAELDLLQLFNTTTDPMERINLLQEKKGLAAELERDLFRYLEKVERKTYRPLLTKSFAGN